MWLINASPALFTDLYELTMAQAYYRKGMDQTGYFEVFVRRLPKHWGFFVMAGFAGTSNVFAARLLDLPPSGTMAHSFIEAHESEEQAFRNYAELYGDRTILLVDTYDSIEGIRTAARIAQKFRDRGVRIRGIRLDSGDLVELSRFARDHFEKAGVEFLSIFASGDLDEFRIAELLDAGAQIDGFGVGTRFTTSQHAPSIGIVYKIARYGDRDLYKTSPEKGTIPGRKTLLRSGSPTYEKDTVIPFEPQPDDLLQPFEVAEPMAIIQERLQKELSALPDSIKWITKPPQYPVAFSGFST